MTNVGGEWLINFEVEDQSYCLDEGMNGKPSASVYWTYYGTTDLLDKALAAGCSSNLDIQRYVWAHRQEASDSGSAYVYQASEAGWQNVMTTATASACTRLALSPAKRLMKQLLRSRLRSPAAALTAAAGA